MKKSLREKLEARLKAIKSRIRQLERHTEDYKVADNFEGAMKSDIKRGALEMVYNDLTKILD